MLAYDFGGTKVSLATAAPDGAVIGKGRLESGRFASGSELLAAAIAAGRELAAAQAGGRLAAIGVSTMGITYPDRVAMAPNVPGWEELRMEASFAAAFPGVPVGIDNDVKAAALAEAAKGSLAGVGAGMYVNLGTGIAVALTLDGRVVHGGHGAAGEIAYCLRGPAEPLGYADGAAPFEDFAGGKSVGRRASERFGRPLTARDVFAMSRERADAAAFVEETLAAVAFQLANALILWDPSKVAFGGGMMGAADAILPRLRSAFQRFVPFPPELCEARFREDAGLYGAVELARARAAD